LNIEKHLILVKGEDKTEAISRCTYENGKWNVEFHRDKVYPYNYLNVQWLKNPVSLDPATTVVYQNNQPLSGVKAHNVFEYLKQLAEKISVTDEQDISFLSKQ